jgi:predicted esterase
LAGDPHRQQAVLSAGVPLANATAAMVLVHGRGASAMDILTLANEFGEDNLAYLAPQAAHNSWYPERFLVPSIQNEPWLTSALQSVERAVNQAPGSGIPAEKVILLGFSQGACLALEYAARNARRYGAIIGLSGGLIGADNEPRDPAGNLQGTPVFLGCSDVDFHIPVHRVHHAARILTDLGGQVETRLYPGMGHAVNEDEIQVVMGLIQAVLG